MMEISRNCLRYLKNLKRGEEQLILFSSLREGSNFKHQSLRNHVKRYVCYEQYDLRHSSLRNIFQVLHLVDHQSFSF